LADLGSRVQKGEEREGYPWGGEFARYKKKHAKLGWLPTWKEIQRMPSQAKGSDSPAGLVEHHIISSR
jgi:hypothetical protein